MAAAWLATALLCALAAPATAQPGPQLVLQGRFSPGAVDATAGLPQTFSWAGSSVFTSFEGANAVEISLAAKPTNGDLTVGINWFRFFVDGQPAADGFTSAEQLDLTATIPVTSSRHTLRIAKLSDAGTGEATLRNITLNGGSFLPPSGLPGQVGDRRILFLGDSYTTGYGDAGAFFPGTCNPAPAELTAEQLAACAALQVADGGQCSKLWYALNLNSLAAYSAMAAQALGADFQLVANSGAGMVAYSLAAKLYAAYMPPKQYQALLPSNRDFFARSVFGDAGSAYDLQAWLPQVVVVASGTNDWHAPQLSLKEWVPQAADFLQQVSEALGQPTIVVMAWPERMQEATAYQDGGADSAAWAGAYAQAMASLATEAHARCIANVHLLQLDERDFGSVSQWCASHPSATAQRSAARQLAAFLQALLPQWRDGASALSPAVDEAATRPNTSSLGVSTSLPFAPAPALVSVGTVATVG